MAVNWLTDILGETWASIRDIVKVKTDNLAKMDFTGDTNLPDGTIRWNSVSSTFEKWNSGLGSWGPLAATYGINVDKVDGLDASAFAAASHVGAGGGAHAGASSGSAGFMSAADKIKIDAATSGVTPSTIVMRDASGHVSAVAGAIGAHVPQAQEVVGTTGAQSMAGPLELNAVNTEVFANGGWITGNAGKGSLTWRGGDGAVSGRQWRWTLSDTNYFAVLRDETGGTNRLLINWADGETYAGAGAAFRVHHDGNSPLFESAEFPIATGSIASASHGLGVRPRQFWMVLRCKIAEHTYNVDDELIVVGGFSDNGLSRGVTVWADASTIGWSSGNNIGFMAVQKVNGSGNSVLQLTNANWKSVLRANP